MTVDALPSREQALALLHEWVQNPALRKHCYAVEVAMRAYARHYGEDEARWGLTGLIHDFDWERHPDAERHPMQGSRSCASRAGRGRVPRRARSRHVLRRPA